MESRGFVAVRKYAFLMALCVFGLPLFAAPFGGVNSSARRTSVRFLKLAEKYCEAGDYKTAGETADMGISYCADVADLWYIKAQALNKMGHKRAEVLPLVEKSLHEGAWVDYNKDVARVLYADVLCDVGRYGEALTMLDGAPYIYSADAQFIRAKAYYRTGTEESVALARRKVDDSRKMYPEDTRFPLLFFKHERALEAAGGKMSSEAKAIANAFILRIDSYKDCSAELFVLAAMMAEGERKTRMLYAFSANEMEHLLYAQAALEEGIMSTEEAADYFFGFADETVSFEDMSAFLSCAAKTADDDVKALVKAHLDSYEGLLTKGTTGDLEPNLFVKYSRGRAETVNYDANNDGVSEWVAKCDFGIPTSVEAGGSGKRLKAEIDYGSYPAVTSVTLVTGKVLHLSLVEDTYLWSPFEMKIADEWQRDFGAKFFVPQELKDIPKLDMDALVGAAWKCNMPIDEREGAEVTFTMLDGLRQTAEYTSGGKVYAKGTYSAGLPVLRMIDNDGDGIFETVERYSKAEKKGRIKDTEDPFTEDVYVSRVEVDLDEDTVPDFIEEYTEDGGRISTWDQDSDGQWDVRYVASALSGGELEEKAYFFVPPRRDAVCIESVAGEPIEVTLRENSVKVSKGTLPMMYWIGNSGTEKDEAAVSSSLSTLEQGVSVLVESEDKRVFAVRIGDKSYAYIIHDDKKDEK